MEMEGDTAEEGARDKEVEREGHRGIQREIQR